MKLTKSSKHCLEVANRTDEIEEMFEEYKILTF
ncbi:Uncharacterised protein [Streptococcus pneumoniae]|nr:Uncharacterised protein [Streptococcus pneumoniae]